MCLSAPTYATEDGDLHVYIWDGKPIIVVVLQHSDMCFVVHLTILFLRFMVFDVEFENWCQSRLGKDWKAVVLSFQVL
jgi:hypothetical protein